MTTLSPHLEGILRFEETFADHRCGNLGDGRRVDVNEGVVHDGKYRDAAVTLLDVVIYSRMSQERRRKAGKSIKQQ